MGQETEGLLDSIIEEQRRTLAALERLGPTKEIADYLERIRDSQREIGDLVDKIAADESVELDE